MNKPETIQPEKVDLSSMNVAEQRRDELHRSLGKILPEAFSQGLIDFDQLKRSLGEFVDDGKERFGLSWPGKTECYRIIQQPSYATLLPVRNESEHFDKTDNLFIEGDNLEVLKLLQKSYFGKVKLIYIDPPYNTGNEFIYPDKFAETLDTYLAYTGQIDSEGKKFSTHTDASGRYHSRWLSMMYPRLYLARNLLRDDGCVFISIDDTELANLRSICDEIFGEEHFCGIVSRSTGTRMGFGSPTLSSELDYILIYSKTDEIAFPGLPMTDDDLSIYDQQDNRGKYLIRSLRRTGGENRREDRPSMYYPVTAPDGTTVYPIAPAGYESRWVCGKQTYEALVADNMIEWKKMRKNGVEQWQVYQKHYVGSALKQPSNLWSDEEGNKKATRDLNDLFDGLKVFDHPKPVGLLQRMLSLATLPATEDIVMDFFAGSGSTGQAVWAQNELDGGNRRFVLVQLPEKLDEAVKAQQVALQFCEKTGIAKTVAELCKERLRRSGKLYGKQCSGELKLTRSADQGFRVFKLGRSNFQVWDGGPLVAGEISKQIELHVDHLSGAASPEDILYELLLKSGFPITTKVDVATFAGEQVFSVGRGSLLIFLGKSIGAELIDALADARPLQVICLDEAFKGNDQLKANAVQTFKARAQAAESEIVFKTV